MDGNDNEIEKQGDSKSMLLMPLITVDNGAGLSSLINRRNHHPVLSQDFSARHHSEAEGKPYQRQHQATQAGHINL